MHREKISCLAEKLCIVRGFHTSQEFLYRRKIFMPRKRTYMDKEREIVYPKSNIYPSASTASFVFEEKKKRKEKKNKHQEEHRRWRQKKHQHCISVYLFILASNEEYIEDYIAKQSIRFICWTSDRSSRRRILRISTKCQRGKKTLSPILLHFFKLTSFISVFVESIQKDKFSKNHRCGRHQKGCSTTWNFS